MKLMRVAWVFGFCLLNLINFDVKAKKAKDVPLGIFWASKTSDVTDSIHVEWIKKGDWHELWIDPKQTNEVALCYTSDIHQFKINGRACVERKNGFAGSLGTNFNWYLEISPSNTGKGHAYHYKLYGLKITCVAKKAGMSASAILDGIAAFKTAISDIDPTDCTDTLFEEGDL